MSIPYKIQKPFQDRLEEASRMKKKYSDKIPIILELFEDTILTRVTGTKKPGFVLDKKKYLVQYDNTVAQFMMVVRRRIKLESHISMFFYVECKDGTRIIPPSAKLLQDLYDEYKDEDQFLYLIIAQEATFGSGSGSDCSGTNNCLGSSLPLGSDYSQV